MSGLKKAGLRGGAEGDCSTPGTFKSNGRHTSRRAGAPRGFSSLLGSKMLLCGLSLVVSLRLCSQLEATVTYSGARLLPMGLWKEMQWLLPSTALEVPSPQLSFLCSRQVRFQRSQTLPARGHRGGRSSLRKRQSLPRSFFRYW